MSTDPSIETTPAKESTSSSATILVAILVLFAIGLIAYFAFANIDTGPSRRGGVQVESPYGSPGSTAPNPPQAPSARNGDGRNAGGTGEGSPGPAGTGRAPSESTSVPSESGGTAGTGTPGGRATTESGARGDAASTGALPGEGSR